MNDAQIFLRVKFTELKTKNARFTMRAYARKLGLSSGALSEILSGKRAVSEKSAKKISERLGLSPRESALLSSGDGSGPKPELEYAQLEDDQFHLISDWWHFAILNLINTQDFKANEKWIARRLHLSSQITQEAITRLFRLGLLIKKPNGSWARSQARFQTSTDIANLSIRRAHFQDLDLIRDSLENVELHMRDITAITFAINPTDLPEFKKAIRDFQDKVSEKFETKNTTEVYRLATQLFPLTGR